MIIYAIRHDRNNNEYIGQTIQDPKKYWSKRKSQLNRDKHWNEHLQRTWNKYGSNEFTFELVDASAKDLDELNLLEEKYVAERGYFNQRGGGNRGKYSKEARLKMKIAKQGVKRSPFSKTHRVKIKKSNTGKHKGENNSNAKLTSFQVLEIRRLYNRGESKKNLAKGSGLSISGIKKIVLRYTWKHI